MTDTQETNCAFQYAKMRGGLFSNTKIVCDKTKLTITEAKSLWNQYYSDCAKHIKDGGTCEMVIWIDMIDEFSFDKHLQYISTDAESDGIEIWETSRKYFPKHIEKQ